MLQQVKESFGTIADVDIRPDLGLPPHIPTFWWTAWLFHQQYF